MKAFGLIASITLCFVCGCSTKIGPTEIPIPTAVPTIVVAENKSAITGYVISMITKKALNDTPVRLARVFWDAERKEGAYVLDGANSPSTLTQIDGRFVIENIDPGDYVIVVGDVFSTSYIVSKPDGKAEVYMAVEGEVLDVDILQVALP